MVDKGYEYAMDRRGRSYTTDSFIRVAGDCVATYSVTYSRLLRAYLPSAVLQILIYTQGLRC